MKNIANANIYLNYELNSNNLYNIDNIDNQKLISEQDDIKKAIF